MSYQHLNSRRRRARKYQLAVRDGAYCAYCGCPFTSLRHATLDHVAPVSVFRTWSADHLVLACGACNHAKADRFPLLLALLLIGAMVGAEVQDVQQTSALDRSTTPAVGDRPIEPGGRTADRADVHPFTDAFTVFTGGCPPVDVRLLARLAHARRSADRTACESGGQLGVHQRVHRVHEHTRAAVHRSSSGGREVDRPARTGLGADLHGSVRTAPGEAA
ncbi:HNH endonuclease [Streptomyces sp. NPDC051567]|uniref:HNH endonuclease n=1 Tax=Streptomyces sp. NPDC051567 TaxID=3365660 RepID=UPI0037967BB9